MGANSNYSLVVQLRIDERALRPKQDKAIAAVNRSSEGRAIYV